MADPIPAAPGPAAPAAAPATPDPAAPAPRAPVVPPKPAPAADASLTVDGDTGEVEAAVEGLAESPAGTTKAPESYWSGGLTGSLDFDKYWGEVGAGHDPAAPYPMSEWRIGFTGRKNWRITENGRWSWGLQLSLSRFQERSKPREVEAVLGDDVAPAEGRPDLTTAPTADPGEEAPAEVSLPGAPVDTDGDGTVDAPGEEVPVTSEDIGYTDTAKYQPESWGLELALGVPFTFLFNPSSDSVRVGLQAGPVAYGRKGWYKGGHDIGAPYAADHGYFNKLNGYWEVGAGLRAGLAIQTAYVDFEPNVTWTPWGHRWVDYSAVGRELSSPLGSAGYSVQRLSAGIDILVHGDTTPEQVAAAKAEAPDVAPPPVAVAKCEDFDDKPLEAKREEWIKTLFKNGKVADGLLDTVKAGLRAIGMSNADIDSLSVRIYTFHAFNGATGMLPADPSITRDVVLRITREVPKAGGGTERQHFILWDKTGLSKTPHSALKPLEASTLVDPSTGWIAENERYVEVEKAKDAVTTAYKPDALSFAVNLPNDRQLTDAAGTADQTAFEAYVKSQGIFKNLAEYAKAKKNIDALVAALKNPALTDVDFYLQGTASRDGGDQANYDLSKRRAALVKIWLEKAGLKPRGSLGTGEDNRFLDSRTGTVATDRQVRVIFAKFPTGTVPTTVPSPDFEAMVTQVMAHRTSTTITFTTPGTAAKKEQMSPVKIADRILISEVPDGTKGTVAPGAACAALELSAKFYLMDGSTSAPGLAEPKHQLPKPAWNIAPWLDEPERPAEPAGPAGGAPAGAAPEAADVPEVMDVKAFPYKDYDAAEDAIKGATATLSEIEANLPPAVKDGKVAEEVEVISKKTEPLRSSIIANAISKIDQVPKLVELIDDLNGIKADIAATSDDDLDTFGFWVSGDDNRKELNAMVDAQIARAQKYLDDLRKFLAEMELLKSAGPVAPVAAAPVAAPVAAPGPVAAPAPSGPIVKAWRSETIKSYAGGGSAAGSIIGIAEVEIESDLTADQLKARVRVQIEGAPTRSTVGVAPVSGKAKTFKVTFGFNANKNEAKNVEMFDMQPGTPDTPIYKGHVAIDNATPATAKFKAGAKTAAAPAPGAADDVL